MLGTGPPRLEANALRHRRHDRIPESFRDHDIDRKQACREIREGTFRFPAKFAHEGKPAIAHQHHLPTTRLASLVGRLARLVEIEAVGGPLDRRHRPSIEAKRCDEVVDQIAFAATSTSPAR